MRSACHSARVRLSSQCSRLLTFAPSAMAVDEVNTKKFREAVTVNGILAHERALQRIANAERRHARVGHAGLRRLGRRTSRSG